MICDLTATATTSTALFAEDSWEAILPLSDLIGVKSMKPSKVNLNQNTQNH